MILKATFVRRLLPMVVQSSELSSVQFKTLRAIQRFVEENGFPPTVGELAESLTKTKASVHSNLDMLIRKGFIKRTVGKARSIEIIKPPQANVIDVVAIPLLGNVPAGVPVTVEEHSSEEILVEASVVGKDPCFALKVSGDSMMGADILEGDVLVVRQQPLAAHGEIVVASIDGEVTVKRLDITRSSIRLMPENADFKPIEITHNNDLKILGKVIATRRRVILPR
jgi:repressor LexA